MTRTDLQHLVAFIAPNKAVAENMQESLKEFTESGHAIIHIANLSNLWGDIAQLKVKGVTALVARGGTYREIEALHQDIPLVRARIVTTDVLYAMQRAIRLYPGRTYYLVLINEADFVEEICREALPVHFECIRFDDLPQLQQILHRLSTDMNAVIIGSGLAEALSESSTTLVDITMRSSTLGIYYRQAVNLVNQIRRYERQRLQMQGLFSSIEDGLMMLSSRGTIRQANEAFLSILGVTKEAVMQVNISDIFPSFPYYSILGQELTRPLHRLIPYGNNLIDLSISSSHTLDTHLTYFLVARVLRNSQGLEKIIRSSMRGADLSASGTFSDIHTQSEQMRTLLLQAQEISKLQQPVLIEGEPGTGRILLAQAIHNSSERAGGPFIAVNLSSMSPEQQEEILMGNTSSDPTKNSVGLLDLANGGTICLYDIDCLSSKMQTKLLRLFGTMYSPSKKNLPSSDVRVIGIIDTPLWVKVSHELFLKALYSYFRSSTLSLPPLRSRSEDVPQLFSHFIRRESLDPVSVPEEFLNALQHACWPGNISQLKLFAKKYCYQHGKLTISDIPNLHTGKENSYISLPLSLQSVTSETRIDLHQIDQQAERTVIEALLTQNFKKSEIAAMLGISRQALHKKISSWRQEDI